MFGLSTELISKGRLATVKRFRALALRVSESDSTASYCAIRSDQGLTFETSALESLYGGQFTFSYQLC